MALEEARSGEVLWLEVGSSCYGSWSNSLQQVPNLTCLHLPIATAADSKAALQELVTLVRSQRYSLVVLDCVSSLVPPPPGAARPGAVGAAEAPAKAHPAPEAPRQADEAPDAGRRWGGGPVAAAHGATLQGGAASGAAWRGGSTGVGGWWEDPDAWTPVPTSAAGTAAAGTAAPLRPAAEPAAPGSAAQQQRSAEARGASQLGSWASAGRGHAVNLKFLQNLLPVLLESTLAELAVSCGPGLRTTTLLLNAYTPRAERPGRLPEAANAASRSGSTASVGSDSGVDPNRLARHAIVSHAAASLHLLPTAVDAASGGASHGRSLHAVLTQGQPSGRDGSPLLIGSLVLPVRLVEHHPRPD